VFRTRALPILLKAETEFAELYDNRMGRPNVSAALIIGALLLKEIRNLTDMRLWSVWNLTQGGGIHSGLSRIRRICVRRHCIIFGQD